MDARARRRWIDAITASRVPLALVMVVYRRRRRVVATAFVTAALTDVVDGPLARRCGTASERGARLDSAADAVLSTASAIAAAGTLPPSMRRTSARAAAAIGGVRLAALAVTRARFGRWSAVHTWSNKASGACLAIVVTVALVLGRMPVRALGAAALIAGAAAVEELAIVSTCERPDPDRRSIFGC